MILVWVRTVLLSLVAVYLALLGALYVFQRSVLYHPEHFYVSPAAANADPKLVEFVVRTEDGLDLKGWYAPAAGKPFTIVFFHGNADNLRTLVGIAEPFIRGGYGILLAEYRGYSGLPGKPTEQGLYADARAYVRALNAAGVSEKNIVFFAHSLGTGVAVEMATEFNPAGLILMSPHLSIGKVAQVQYPMFPAELLTTDRFENFKKISRVTCPLLIGHGERDVVIPFAQGNALFELANQPKAFHAYPEAGHNEVLAQGFFKVIFDWLARLPAP